MPLAEMSDREPLLRVNILKIAAIILRSYGKVGFFRKMLLKSNWWSDLLGYLRVDER